MGHEFPKGISSQIYRALERWSQASPAVLIVDALGRYFSISGSDLFSACPVEPVLIYMQLFMQKSTMFCNFVQNCMVADGGVIFT